MAIENLSKMLQTHLVSKVGKATKSKTSLRGLDTTKMRSVLDKGFRHDALISDKGFNTLISQMNSLVPEDPKAKSDIKNIRYPITKVYYNYGDLSKADQTTFKNAVDKFAKVKVDDILEYLKDGTNTKKIKYKTFGGGSHNISIKDNNPTDKGIKDRIITIENIPQTMLINLILEFMAKPPISLNTKEAAFLKENMQAGHTSGIFTLKMLNVFGLISPDDAGRFSLSRHSKKGIKIDGEVASEKTQERLLAFMNDVIHILNDADRISSNMPEEMGIFLDSLKSMGGRHPHARTEIQLAFLNKESGNTFIGLGGRIKRLADVANKLGHREVNVKQPEAVQSILEGIRLLVENLKKDYSAREDALSDSVKTVKDNLDKFVTSYLTEPGSPIFIKSIEDTVIQILKTGKVSTSKNYRAKVSDKVVIPTVRIGDITTNARNSLNKLKNKIKQQPSKESSVAKPKIPKAKSIKFIDTQDQISILPTLQVLLDANLTEQIKQNMKKPSLQNKTGRFAESVKVERLSESRAGMITAFYRYMRSPYQTFEPGFRQGSNARNPKTLISKSIREIASQLVGNRLRSISI